MKRIEILSNFRSGGRNFYAGEIRIVHPDEAAHFCKSGWAKDLGGELHVGTPDTKSKVLSVDDGVHASGSDSP